MDRSLAHAVRTYGDGPPVIVFGHGIGGNQGHWNALVAHFRPSARLVTFALTGSVDADPALFSPVRHSSILGYADDLAMLCAQLGIRGAVYVGHSMSAMAGALASAADPGLFSRMVLINCSARYVDDPATGYVGGFSQEQVDGILQAIAADYVTWASGFAPLVMGNDDRPEFATEFANILHRHNPAMAATMFRSAFTSDFRAFVPRVQVPTLLLQSDSDPAVPANAARWLATTMPDAQLNMLKSCGHFPHVVDPAEIIEKMESFILE